MVLKKSLVFFLICISIGNADAQKNANKYGFIKHAHKNHIANLVVLCDACHDKIDKAELIIMGYKETSCGKVLITNHI